MSTTTKPISTKSRASSNGDAAGKPGGHGKRAASADARDRTLTVSLQLPQGATIDQMTAQRLLTLALVSSGHLSQSQAAKLLHVSRYDLIDMMGEHSLPIVRLSEEETATEGRHLRELQALRATPLAARAALP
jgi:hypothetical protein